jgi:DNA repair exonuclease SbcCD nuclease subunit
MKFVITGDLHIKMWQDRSVDEEGIPLKLIETLNAVEQMCTYATENDIKNVFIAGDINDSKGNISTRALIMFQRVIAKYTDLTFHLIPGNHDAVARNMNHHAAQIFENISNVKVYNEVTRLDNITFIPWKPAIIDDIIESESNDILISHFGLSDAQLSNGMSIKTSINANDLSKFKLVLLGHYHMPQSLYNVYYVGSPIPFKRDEIEEKRFLVVDTNTLEVESVPTIGYRKYTQVILDEDTDLKELDNLIKESKESGDFVIVKKSIKDLPKSLRGKLDDIQLVDIYSEDSQIRGISSYMNITDQVKKYLEIMGVQDITDHMNVLEEVMNDE